MHCHVLRIAQTQASQVLDLQMIRGGQAVMTVWIQCSCSQLSIHMQHNNDRPQAQACHP